MLYLQRNRIGRNGLDDVRGLLECPSVTTVDIQDNKIEDPAILEEILVRMPNLKVLYLKGNPCVNKIKNYRKTVISKIPTLLYLDDRPVFADDRRNAEAFARGGIEEERKEREKIAQEKRAKDDHNRKCFQDMIKKAREEKRIADEKAAAEKAAAEGEAKAIAAAADDGDGDEAKGEPAEGETVVQIDTSPRPQHKTVSVAASSDNEEPPALEEVDSDTLKAEK